MDRERSAAAESAARSIAAAAGLDVTRVAVLQNSNKLTLRLLPADVLARVAPETDRSLQFEVDVARRTATRRSPVAALDPRPKPEVHTSGGFAVTFWRFYPSRGRPLEAPEYASGLLRLHETMRSIDVSVPHFTERVDQARRLVADRDRSPDLPEIDRAFLAGVLDELRGVGRGAEQVLHGEPHEGNVLATADGPRFIDLETCCRGPLEFDLAHAPDEVAEHYPGLDADLLRDCRRLVLALVVTWRWDRDDRFPDGRAAGREWLAQLRALG